MGIQKDVNHLDSEHLAVFPSWSIEAEESGPATRELQSKVTQDGKNNFWCL